MPNCKFEKWLSLVKLLFHIVFCRCYHVYGELKIISSIFLSVFILVCVHRTRIAFAVSPNIA